MSIFTYSVGEESLTYHDRKRYWWLMSLVMPLLPVFAIFLYFSYDSLWVLFAPLLISYFLLPLLDVVVGTNRSNPPEEVVPQMEADPYYQRLLHLTVPLHYITLVVATWFLASSTLEPLFYVLFAVMIGMYNGFSINTAHEIGHKNSKFARRISRFCLSVCGYGHFCIEHNLGHHRDVATPLDPASSRMGENIYTFMLREIPGAFRRGWVEESKRLQKRGFPTWTWRNHILQSYALTLFVQGVLVILFGLYVLPFLLIHNFFAWFQLTSANYIEHYGLLRNKLENGRYEPCQPHHSWNTNHLASNVLMFQLERHSDHHANPMRSYQSLRSMSDLPELPNGYFGMYFLAYFPPLWFKVMDPRVLRVPHINGDFEKVNLVPEKKEMLMQRYAELRVS